MFRSVQLTIALALLASAPAGAEFPYPGNPAPCIPDGEPDCIEAWEFHRYLQLPAAEPPILPNDFGGNWKLSSARSQQPDVADNPQELLGVTGASVDRAWQVSTGRPDVLIAVLDSGIRWGERQPDLVNKFYLNRGELPIPEGSTNAADPHDRNRDGIFNVADYLDTGGHQADSRVSDQNGTGAIDPEDLIFLFTDGVDDDANGYTDDISGWDFWEDDNNPLDEVRYSHGTGESKDSAAEANNGIGNPGTCPNCLLLEVRVADSFVANVNDFAQGVLFAVDSGADVIQEALGTVNNSAFGQQAVDYAYRNGAVVIASAADEQSRHNNYPATYAHTVEVNSVTRFFDDAGFTQSPQSYLYVNGCTNFSGHVHLAVPSTACSSEATGLSAGMAGLVISAAKNEIARGNLTPYPLENGFAPFALSAEEVKQILTLTADDVNFDARDDTDPPLPQNYATTLPLPGITQQSERFPSVEGWDQFFGYGRINAEAAVRRVAAGVIPPEVAIEAPIWFAYIQEKQGTLSLAGRVAAVRTDSFTYSVDVAPGVQPTPDEFVQVHSSSAIVGEFDGVLAEIELHPIAKRMPNGITGPATVGDGSLRGDPDRFAFTVRVRVIDDQGRRGEDRRTFFLHEDPSLVEGYPRHLDGDGASPPKLADIDHDGVEELILGTSNGAVHAYRLDGTEAPGWPVFTDPLEVHQESAAYREGGIARPRAAILGGVAIGDLDGDGDREVVAADLKGKVYAWTADGRRLPGFPVSTLPEYSNARRSERNMATDDGLLPDKNNRHDRDNRLGRGFAGGPTLANLDASEDGSLEILAGALDRHVYAWFNDGTPVPGWPVMLRDPDKVESVDPLTDEVRLVEDARAEIGSKIIRSPSIGDLNGDGRPEVLSVVNEGYKGLPNAIFDGLLANLLVQAGLLDPGNTRVYAIHSEGTRRGTAPLERGWNPDAFVDGWPVETALIQTDLLPVVGTGSNGPPALGDLDGDGLPEIATFSAVGPVYLFRGDGAPFLGFNRGRAAVLRQLPFGPFSNSEDAPTFGALGGPAIAPLSGKGGNLNIIAPTSGLGSLVDAALPARQFPADNHITAWDTSGAILPAFPRESNDLQFFVVPVVADITGDGKPEVLQGSGVRDLHAVDVDGNEPAGWPKFTAGWTVAPPAVGDLDGDGMLEVAHTTREGYLFIWRTEGDECGFQPWRHGRHDEWGTSNIDTDARPPATVREATLASTTATSATFALDLGPGDDHVCGAPAEIDVRFADEPIEGPQAFASASPAAVDAAPEPGRQGGELIVGDERFAGRSLYFALRSVDAAGNRSGITDLGGVAFPPAATSTPNPTTTATVTPPATATPSNTATVTPTEPATATPTPVATDDGDGCQLQAPGEISPALLILGWFGTLGALRRRKGRN